MSFLAVCHTIATTKLDWLKKAEDATGDGEVDRIALTITRELQTGEQKEEVQTAQPLALPGSSS